MKVKFLLLASFLCLVLCSASGQNKRVDGYKGIWFTLGQLSEFGDKYSGGLGTYTADHIPIAIFAPKAAKTFFVYGGTTRKEERHLLIMISYYDHKKHLVPKPVVVYDKIGVDDPHDNASLSIDGKGFLWVFVSGRNTSRPGLIFRSSAPYSIDAFEKVYEGEMTYPQPWWMGNDGFFYFFTKYTQGRELYWSTSADGLNWQPEQKLAGFGGHYQVSNVWESKLATAFNFHPGGDVNKRTNLYYLQTNNRGSSWNTVQGNVITTPLSKIHSDALVKDYQAEGKLVYINDINFDKQGNPVILYVVSRFHEPGPKGDPREWTIAHWHSGRWNFHKVCESTHNYDMGSLYVEGNTWRVVGPTEPGPQRLGTGGEMAVWESTDMGRSWAKLRDITTRSIRNHSYARRPVNAHKDFYALWADGNADTFSESRLYFTNKAGDKVWELPYEMKDEFAVPENKTRRH